MESEAGDNAKNLWKNQQVEPIQISLAELRKRAQKLEKRIHRRNLREYVAGAIVIACFGYYIFRFPDPMIRFGCVLVIASSLFVLYQLRKRGAARAVPAEMAFRDCLDFHRKELERQRDLLRSVWTWYILPLVPGVLVFMLGDFQWQMTLPNAAVHAGHVKILFGLRVAIVVVIFIGVGKLNQWAARRLQRRIDALNSVEKEF
jgi:hypothetical protein